MQMKILVVDDEEIIRDGLSRKIERLIPNAVIVGKAQDANQALELVKLQHPDIVITDIRMPETDGLKFISLSKEIYKDICYIIISGYQDFEYARNAIRLGVEDYLLKPIDNDQLKEVIRKLELKIIEGLRRESMLSDLKSKANHGINFLKNKYLMDLMTYTNEFNINSLEKNLSLIGIDFLKSDFTVLNLYLSSLEEACPFSLKDDMPLLKFSIKNIAEEIFSKVGAVFSFENLKTDKFISILINHDTDLESSEMTNFGKLCYDFLFYINKYFKISVSLGIGKTYDSISGIPASFLESYSAAMQKIVIGDNKVIFSRDIPSSNRITFFLSEESKMLLQNYIREGNYKKASSIVATIFASVKESSLFFNNIKLLYLDLLLIFSKTLKEAGGSWEKIFSQDIFSEEFLLQYSSLDLLHTWVNECIVQICTYITNLTKSSGKKVIDEMMSYISNYYYSEMNLNDFASKYYINPNYLSQLFKNEIGENFVDHLTKARLEKAKDLLLNTELKAYKISKMVGYGNSRYFSEVFQRHVGMTPTEFRQKIQ
jgi:two-component system, response regulator YesN